MSKIEYIATTPFGLEAVAKNEIKSLDLEITKVEDGKIHFTGDESTVPKANLWLRSVDRVLVKLAEFKALSFEDLFQGVKAIPWAEWITEDGNFIVNGKAVKSKLHSVPHCQSITEKALVEKLKGTYDTKWFKKTGALYTVQVSVLKDIATITLDTSGNGLHKRGYREAAVTAPLKETLAASMLQISYWSPDRVLVDPFCGSGTIPIEAAMIGRNIAPGLNRKFASEEWPRIGKELWKTARLDAYQKIDYDKDLKIYASDINPEAIETAKKNAEEAGVDDCIEFSVKPIKELRVDDNYGVMVTNPPYGIRIGTAHELIGIYKEIRRIFRNKATWSLYLITSDERFEQVFKKADKKRKLYNGRILVNYYQYFGKKPKEV